jgi:hypothetical protein
MQISENFCKLLYQLLSWSKDSKNYKTNNKIKIHHRPTTHQEDAMAPIKKALVSSEKIKKKFNNSFKQTRHFWRRCFCWKQTFRRPKRSAARVGTLASVRSSLTFAARMPRERRMDPLSAPESEQSKPPVSEAKSDTEPLPTRLGPASKNPLAHRPEPLE